MRLAGLRSLLGCFVLLLAIGNVLAVYGPAFSHMDSDHFRRLSSLSSFAHREGIPPLIPQDVLVGPQGAGKTSFLEILLTIPLSVRDSDDVGTRCPVYYHLFHLDDPETPVRIEFEGRKLKTGEQLREKLSAHMDKISGFSAEAIEVKVWSPNVVNYLVLDLPGFRREDDSDSDAINNVIAQFARNPEFSIVAVMKMGRSMVTAFEISMLDSILTSDALTGTCHVPPRRNWRKDAVILENFARSELNYITTFADAEKFFNSRTRNPKHERSFAIELVPDQKTQKEHLSYERQLRRLKNDVIGKERDVFDAFFAGLTGAEQPAALRAERIADWNKTVGTFHALNFVFDRLAKRFTSYVPRVRGQLELRKAKRQKRLDSINATLATNEPEELRRSAERYFADFAEHYVEFLGAKLTTDIHSSVAGGLGGPAKDKRRWSPTKYGVTLAEELNFLGSTIDVPFWEEDERGDLNMLTPDLVQKALDASELFRHNAARRFTGFRRLERWTLLFQVILLLRKSHEYGLDDIENFASKHVNDRTNVFPTSAFIKLCVTSQLSPASKGLHWFSSKAISTFDSTVEIIERYMLDEGDAYAALRPRRPHLNALAREVVTSVVEGHLRDLASEWHQEVRRADTYFDFDKIPRQLLSISSVAWALNIASERMLYPEESDYDIEAEFVEAAERARQGTRSQDDEHEQAPTSRESSDAAHKDATIQTSDTNARDEEGNEEDEDSEEDFDEEFGLDDDDTLGSHPSGKRARAEDHGAPDREADDPNGDDSEPSRSSTSRRAGAKKYTYQTPRMNLNGPTSRSAGSKLLTDVKDHQTFEEGERPDITSRNVLRPLVRALRGQFGKANVDQLLDGGMTLPPHVPNNFKDKEKKLAFLNKVIRQYFEYEMRELVWQFEVYVKEYLMEPFRHRVDWTDEFRVRIKNATVEDWTEVDVTGLRVEADQLAGDIASISAQIGELSKIHF